MNHTHRYAPVAILFLLMLTGCAQTSKLFIEKKTDFGGKNSKAITKIVSITPSVFVNEPKNKRSLKSLQQSIDKVEMFEKSLKENAKLNDIDLQIVSTNDIGKNALDYFNDLKPLKDQILLANIYQNAELSDKSIKGNYFKAPISFFSTAPRLSPEFGKLSEKYKTKYFCVNGIFSMDGRFKFSNITTLIFFPPWAFNTNAVTYYYTIIVDVEKGEIVYREIRGVDEKALKTNLDAMLYDSFNIIKNKKGA